MKIAVIDNRSKRLHRLINISIVAFTILWIVIFIFMLTSIEILERLAVYFMLISALPLVIGLIAFSLLVFIGKKKVISVDPSKSSYSLTLNITKEDFEKSKLNHLDSLGNYILVEDSGNRKEYEISSGQVKKLLSQDGVKSSGISFKKRKTKSLDGPPKAILDSAMWMLWGAS